MVQRPDTEYYILRSVFHWLKSERPMHLFSYIPAPIFTPQLVLYLDNVVNRSLPLSGEVADIFYVY